MTDSEFRYVLRTIGDIDDDQVIETVLAEINRGWVVV